MKVIDTRNNTASQRALKDGTITVLEYEQKNLPMGDIVVSDKVAIERKGVGEKASEDSSKSHDFTASIKDGRLFEQLEKLKEAFEKPIIILEGFNKSYIEESGIHINSIYGAFSKIAFEGVGLIPTSNMEETTIAIERIAYREQYKKEHSVVSRRCAKEMSLEQKRSFLIEGMEKVGHKTAQELIAIFTTPENVINAIKQTKIVYTRNGTIKGISGPIKDTNISGAGPKFVLENQLLLFNVENPQKSEPQGLKTSHKIQQTLKI